ncbi:hypothetical protein [Indioceanicola profundi]|uniref:hypothetical protein n=1 Tax=Indioceanicola profundi TaxID=2220096 RepID=UPI000E6ACBC6|nr:hypothetical protein [Indioceanicola profundi]
MLSRAQLTAPAITLSAITALAVLGACSVSSPIPGGGYRVNELPAEERQMLARPRFEQFPPYDIIAPEAVSANLRSHPNAREYRTAIQQGAEKGPAFAGHLAVASWGCGNECQQWAFIDARNGKVIWGPRTSHGASFQQDSRLFVANPPHEMPAGAKANPRYYIWNGEDLVEMQG